MFSIKSQPYLRIFNDKNNKLNRKSSKSIQNRIFNCLDRRLIYSTLGLFLLANSYMPAVRAEPVPDNTAGTNVTQNGDRFDINGGTILGENLFHSFEKFGLNRDEVANFLSNPDIRNILGRVTGGDASIINGLIQVTGGNSNLFLINPAGIVFGKDATLDLPASFTATTANGIQVGDYWFNALGSNDYSNLVGEPNGFAFASDTPGSIVNAGNISVPQGETINLIGGLVINTGTLEAPEGNINITAVPEKQLVKISPEGSLLSLGLPTDVNNSLSANAELITPVALPELLTGGDTQQATNIEVADNGNIKLTESDVEIPREAGTTIASGKIDVSGDNGGNVNVLGEKVGVVTGNIDASGTNGGGEVLVGGDYKGQGEVPNASRTFIDSDSLIKADAIDNGNGGRVIAWADEATAFYGNISATGGSNAGDGGFVEVSGKDSLIFEGDVDLTAINGSDGMLLLDPKNIRIVGEDNGNNDNLVNDNPVEILNSNITLPDEVTISINRLDDNENVTLEATNRIVFEDVLIGDGNQRFGGALPEETRQDIPLFNNLTARVIPEAGNRGTLQILGNLAVSGNLTLENTNGDIIIGQPGQPKNILVGIDSLRNGVDPNGNGNGNGLTESSASSANIEAPQGSVKLHGGITLNANSDLNIEAQRFTATDPVTLQGNTGGGQPGRDPNNTNNLSLGNPTVTYNIGVVYFGGNVQTINDEGEPGDATDPPILENGEVVIKNSDPIPNVEFKISFPNSDPITEALAGDSNTDATAEINITLLDDIFFEFDDDKDFAQSGIQENILRFERISTDGSIGGGSRAFGNTSFQTGLLDDDNQIAQEDLEVEVEVVAVNPVDETQQASFCNEELNITSIAGGNKVKAICGGQALAFVFTQPKDEEGNPIKITEDLFPELLTGNEFINPNENTSFEFWQPQDKITGFSKFGFMQSVNNIAR